MENEPKSVEALSENSVDNVQNQAPVVSSRRRLLRASLKATPVVIATLASRPSLACHCVAPSAWGSINAANGGKDVDINGNNGFTGSMARYNAAEVAFDPWQYSNFRSASDSCWTTVAGYFPWATDSTVKDIGLDGNQKIQYVQGVAVTYTDKNGKTQTLPRLTVNGLLKALGKATVLNGGAYYPLEKVTAGHNFVASMMIAQLNELCGKLSGAEACYRVNGLSVFPAMAGGAYAPAGVNQSWDKQQIRDYLHNNWFARFN